MLANLHTHTTFCHGNNTPEEIVLAALEKGFCSIGFSSHGYTPYDLTYCMTDTDGYIAEIERLKNKYRDGIQIYLGIEEDALAPVDKSRFDYIIGSCHYLKVNREYLSIDHTYELFRQLLDTSFGGDICRMSHAYFSSFCEYINTQKPDIVGHFDLITKFIEKEPELFSGAEYNKLAQKYLYEALKSEPIFEINTGAITRGFRKTVFPSENLLHILKKENARIILSSDSHDISSLDGCFDEAKKYLYDIGFRSSYILYNREFVPVDLI